MAEKLKRLEADVVIAGSGPAGATIARELSKKGKNVVVLEKGPWIKSFGSLMTFVKANEKQGQLTTIEKDGSGVLQARCIGGGSVTYMGAAAEPQKEMWKKYGIDLTQETLEARKDCRVNTVPDRLVNPGVKRLMTAANELGYPWHMLEKLFDPAKCKIGCSKCTNGCAARAKWTAVEFIEEAQKHGAVILPNVTVRDVIVENGMAGGMRARGKDGQEYEVHAKITVCSAGGVGTARILQRCGMSEAGSTFLADPCILSAGYVKEGRGSCGELTMETGFHDEEHGLFYANALGGRMLAWASLATAEKRKKLYHAMHFNKAFMIMIKANDDLEGRIYLKEGKISKRYTKSDLLKLDYGRVVAEKIMIKAGCDPYTIFHEESIILGHPGGTVKVGTLLDSDLQTKIKNLYCCDTSVFPEHLGIPPTLSLLAISKRLAKHLNAKLSK